MEAIRRHRKNKLLTRALVEFQKPIEEQIPFLKHLWWDYAWGLTSKMYVVIAYALKILPERTVQKRIAKADDICWNNIKDSTHRFKNPTTEIYQILVCENIRKLAKKTIPEELYSQLVPEELWYMITEQMNTNQFPKLLETYLEKGGDIDAQMPYNSVHRKTKYSLATVNIHQFFEPKTTLILQTLIDHGANIQEARKEIDIISSYPYDNIKKIINLRWVVYRDAYTPGELSEEM